MRNNIQLQKNIKTLQPYQTDLIDQMKLLEVKQHKDSHVKWLQLQGVNGNKSSYLKQLQLVVREVWDRTSVMAKGYKGIDF